MNAVRVAERSLGLRDTVRVGKNIDRSRLLNHGLSHLTAPLVAFNVRASTPLQMSQEPSEKHKTEEIKRAAGGRAVVHTNLGSWGGPTLQPGGSIDSRGKRNCEQNGGRIILQVSPREAGRFNKKP